MKLSAAVLTASCAWSALAAPVADSISIDLTRVDARKTGASSGQLQEQLGRELYWFGHFDVGDTKNVKLVIDTGSTDLILNRGLYKPSSASTKFGGNQTFSISYEGVDRAGFGFETINGNLRNDRVTGAGLTVANQTVGNVTSFKFIDTRQKPSAYPGDGIIGFAGPDFSSFRPAQNSWFYNLCQTKAISSCQLGLAYGTSGKGVANLGPVNTKMINGSLVSVPMVKHVYYVHSDVYIDGELIAANQLMVMDEGTNNIQGPIPVTTQIFKKLGYQTHAQTGPSLGGGSPTEVQQAYFQCNKPPVLGFGFPPKSALKNGEKSTVFNVSSAVWDVNRQGKTNNCTSILGGTNGTGSLWLLGQPFFAGHYVNFNVEDSTIGYGVLNNPTGK